MATRILVRRDTTLNWQTANPILAAGEPALDIDTGYVRYGDGIRAFLDLPIADELFSLRAEAAAAQSEGFRNTARQEVTDAVTRANAAVVADAVKARDDARLAQGRAEVAALPADDKIESKVAPVRPRTGTRAVGQGELFINAKENGVVGDGSRGANATNDTVALQRLIDSLAALSRRARIFFPDGDYVIDGVELKSGIELDGMSASYGYGPSAGAAARVRFRPPNGSSVERMIFCAAAGITSAAVRGIDFDGLGTAGRAIHLPRATWCVVERVNFNNFLDQFLLVEGGNACTFRDILGVNGLRRVGRTDIAGSIDIAGVDHWIENIETSAGWDSPLTTNRARTGIVIRASSCMMFGIIGELSEVGIRILAGANGNKLMGSRADKNRTDGLIVAGTRNQIIGNELGNNSQDASDTYVGIRATGRQNVFIGNMVFSPTGGVHRWGFYDETNGGPARVKNIWLGNTGEYGSGGLFYGDPFDGSGSVAQPKRIDANSPTIDATGITVAALHAYNAATTITGIAGGTQGQSLTLITNNTNVTIQNNATIRTSTGADKALAAQRAYRFTFWAGIWYEDGA